MSTSAERHGRAAPAGAQVGGVGGDRDPAGHQREAGAQPGEQGALVGQGEPVVGVRRGSSSGGGIGSG